MTSEKQEIRSHRGDARMKVAVRFTLDVDPDAYRDEYAEPVANDLIRQQVRYDAIEAAREFFSKFSYLRLIDEWDR